jgi:alpha-beta hydrolase superfamily lysophospholipase
MKIEHQYVNITAQNGACVPCELRFPDGAETFVIITHGFGSSKESMTAQMMLQDLPPAGFGAIAYDLPAHGKAEALRTELTIGNCLESLNAVRAYIEERFIKAKNAEQPADAEQPAGEKSNDGASAAPVEVAYFSSSFGAYLTLLSFSKERKRCKAFLRSAAVNMPELFVNDPDPSVLKELEEQGYYIIKYAGPAPVRITKQFFDELKENDLFEAAADIPFDELDVRMVCGEKDMIIDPEAQKRFAKENDIPIKMFDGEDHTLSTYPETPKQVSDLAISFFNGGNAK